MGKHLTFAGALNILESKGDIYDALFSHGTLEIGLYTPKGQDNQNPHDQDEVYLIQAGTGAFTKGEETVNFVPGDVFFVPADMQHRFCDFTEDFAAWVIFYGPTGGEAPA